MEKHCKRSAALEIADSDSRCGMFSAFAGVCWRQIGPESRNSARKGSAVLEKTEKYCAHVLHAAVRWDVAVFLSYLENG